MKYEYMYLRNNNPEKMTAWLNEFGADGWAVVGVVVDPPGRYDNLEYQPHHVVYLMRTKVLLNDEGAV